MILVRDVYQVKYGRGDELVALFKVFPLSLPSPMRILTDASGTFFTVVVEVEAGSIGEYERALQEAFRDPKFHPWFDQMVPLVESGRREFFHIID